MTFHLAFSFKNMRYISKCEKKKVVKAKYRKGSKLFSPKLIYSCQFGVKREPWNCMNVIK
jgi:hypothetical protein